MTQGLGDVHSPMTEPPVPAQQTLPEARATVGHQQASSLTGLTGTGQESLNSAGKKHAERDKGALEQGP